jgi:hypothetical protein
MPTELTSNVAPNDNTEKEGLSLYRIRIEGATNDPDSRILGMDYPSGILIGD